MGLLGLVIYLLTIVWIVVTCAGLALFALGVRGRVADKHLRCRRCRHVYISGGSDPSTCTECGADLRESGSLRIGRRRMNETQIVFSIMLLCASAATVVGVLHQKRMPSVATAPKVVAKKVVNAVAGAQPSGAVVGRFASNDIYYSEQTPASESGSVHRNETIAGDGAVKQPSILQQSASSRYNTIANGAQPAFTGETPAPPALGANVDDSSRQRSLSTTVASDILPDPLAQWSTNQPDWLSFRLDAVAGRTKDASAGTSVEFVGLRALQTDALWEPAPSNIAQGWSPNTAALASQMRVKPQSSAMKPARAGSTATGSGRAGRSRGN